MPQHFTEEQIVQLAPDAASMKAGKGLAVAGKWPLLGQNEQAVWGHCQGSGKAPYQTAVDLKRIAFRCSCPSRKFPCKHGLGLLLLYTAHPELFPSGTTPDWVVDWLVKREEKAGKKEQQQKARTDKPVDEAAQAKRQAARHQKVLHGMDELELWMRDLIRNGLIHFPERADEQLNRMVRRMVDAQAPGLAGRLRAMQSIDYADECWKPLLVRQLSLLFLLMKSYRNLDSLPDDWQQEIRTLVGYPQAKETVLSDEPIEDDWLVVYKRTQIQSDIPADIYWLYGLKSGRWVVYLHFAVPGTAVSVPFILGNAYRAKAYLYKGKGMVRRALFEDVELLGNDRIPSIDADLNNAATRYREAVINNPFMEEIPILVEQLHFTGDERQLHLQDSLGNSIPISIHKVRHKDILFITGGKPFSACLLAGSSGWELVGIWYQSHYYTWNDERN